MRFSTISIQNYRQYRKLALKFKKGEHDLQIIVGDNGTGKTNLLNAFTWCLYGVEPHLGTDDKLRGEPRLNKEVLLEASESRPGSAEIISVEIELEDGGDLVRIQRELPVRIANRDSYVEKKADEVFRVTRFRPNGESRVFVDDQASTLINRILPEAIREYFFFDGEQLSNYFSDKRADAVKAAVDSVSQIESVREMKRRTDNTVKTLMRSLSKAKPSLEPITSKIEKHEGMIKQYEEKVRQAERERDEANEAIKDLDEKLRGIPDIEKEEKKRAKLRTRLKEEEETLESVRRKYFIFARERYVDFAFYEAAKSALAAIAKMEKEKQLPPAIDNGYLQAMLVQHKCEVCNRPLSEEEELHIKELLERFQVSSETSNILTGMRSELQRLVRRVEEYASDREERAKALRAAEKACKRTIDELDGVEKTIAGCPNVPLVKQMVEQRERYQKALEKANQDIGASQKVVDQASNVLRKARQEYERAEREQGVLDGEQAAVNFGNRAVGILEKVERKVVKETREMMARETEDLFRGLVWKDSKCDHIELGPLYQLSLYDKAGFSCAGTCSAAERALLALSFTLAMHDVSGFESPLFIDTPIARASGDNRANFAETLAEVSKEKQLILTFTPDEYSAAISSVFDPIAASYLRLVLDENERVVSVKGD